MDGGYREATAGIGWTGLIIKSSIRFLLKVTNTKKTADFAELVRDMPVG